MKELIWYSFSGAFWIAGFIAAFPGWAFGSDGRLLMLGAAIPIVGFIVHEGYRCLFELKGGYAGKYRRSLKLLWRQIAKPAGFTREDGKWNTISFMIWETTFYDKDIPDDMKTHDRESWHFILAFSSGAYNALLAAYLFYLSMVFGWGGQNWKYMTIYFTVSIVSCGILSLKALLSFGKLMDEEVAMIAHYAGSFRNTTSSLLGLRPRWGQLFRGPWR